MLWVKCFLKDCNNDFLVSLNCVVLPDTFTEHTYKFTHIKCIQQGSHVQLSRQTNRTGYIGSLTCTAFWIDSLTCVVWWTNTLDITRQVPALSSYTKPLFTFVDIISAVRALPA